MKLKALIAGIAGSFVISTAAIAADPIFIPPPAPPPPMAVAPATYDWTGPYAGAAIYGFLGLGLPPAIVGAGGQVGFNFGGGNLVFGVELAVVRAFAAPSVSFLASGKVGFAVGATGRILPYALVVAAFGGGGPGVRFGFGGGVAFGLSDNLSLFVDAMAQPGNVPACCLVRVGANFHFGN